MRAWVRWLGTGALLLGGRPVAAQRAAPLLPPVPAVHGPLSIQVRYPDTATAISAGDSTFVYGTVGDGSATLAIDGEPVRVAPNGAWLAWLRIPRDSSFVLHFFARRGTDTASATWPVVRAGWFRQVGAWVDPASLEPVAAWLPEGEPLPLIVHAAPGASVRLVAPDGSIVPFAADSIAAPVATGVRDFDRDDRNLVRPSRGDHYVGVVRGTLAGRPGVDWLGPLPSPGSACATLDVAVGRDTTRAPWCVSVTRLAQPPVAVRLADNPAAPITDHIIIGRAATTGTYAWFFPRGTRTQADARIGDQVRLRLAGDAIAWVPLANVHAAAAADDPRLAVMSSLTLTAERGATRLRIPLTHPVPMAVSERDGGMTITLYGATADANWTRIGAGQQFVQSLMWEQETQDRITLDIRFARPLWGWRERVDGTDLVFEFRQPPAIDPLRPLAGRLIVVDAGHPPGGACGPTNLCEPEANLAVARRVRDRLVALGAKVVMTRTDSGAVGLLPRVLLADSINADLLISIHNNGLPDGLNPFTNEGTSTFFNHLPALDLARAVESRLVANLGLRDLGVARGDLALVRPTWYPAILTEGLFMMIPEQEAALRSAQGQAAYAAGVVQGVTDFLRSVARVSISTGGNRLQ